MQKYETYFTGEITLHVAQTVNTEQLHHCIPQKCVCFRYIIVNTVHKGDNKDDDDDDDGDDDNDDDDDVDDDNNNNNNKVA